MTDYTSKDILSMCDFEEAPDEFDIDKLLASTRTKINEITESNNEHQETPINKNEKCIACQKAVEGDFFMTDYRVEINGDMYDYETEKGYDKTVDAFCDHYRHIMSNLANELITALEMGEKYIDFNHTGAELEQLLYKIINCENETALIHGKGEGLKRKIVKILASEIFNLY